MNNTFVSTLQEFRGGHSLHELGEKLTEAVKAVRETGGTAQLTYVIKIKPATIGNGVVQFFDDVKIKTPQPSRENGIFFTTDEGRLLRNNPDQKELALKTVAPEVPANAKTVAPEVPTEAKTVAVGQ